MSVISLGINPKFYFNRHKIIAYGLGQISFPNNIDEDYSKLLVNPRYVSFGKDSFAELLSLLEQAKAKM